MVKAQLLIRYADGTDETIGTDDTWQTATGPVVFNNVYLGETYDARLEKIFTGTDVWNNAVIANGPAGNLVAQLQPAVKITRVLKPVSINEAGKDTFIVDMGQNFAGVARIKVSGKSGTQIKLKYGENIHADGSLNFFTTMFQEKILV